MRDYLKDLGATQAIIRQWGAWAHNNPGCGWYTEMPGLSNVLPRKNSSITNRLTDEEAMKIEEIVAMAFRYEPRKSAKDFFILHYVNHRSKNEIAIATKCDPMTVGRQIRDIEHFISGVIASINYNLCG